ncbi:nucleotide exchange factor GrpE [Bacteroidota bacterium]
MQVKENSKKAREIPIISKEDNTGELKNNENISNKDTGEEMKSNVFNKKSSDDAKKTKKKDKHKQNTETEDLKEKIASLEKEKDELKEQILRKTAELDNMSRRSLKEKNEMIDYANAGLFNRLLPIMDDFEKAIEAGENGNDFNSLFQGIEMIYNKAVKTFEETGVKKMEVSSGDDFNVDFHEALLQMPSRDVEEGAIVQVAQDGYMFHDKVLRHAKVITSSGKPDNNDADNNENKETEEVSGE